MGSDKIKILYIADLGSAHDLKWVSYFSQIYQCFVISRTHHRERVDHDFLIAHKIRFVGYISDFSTAYFWKNSFHVRRIRKWIGKYKIDIFHMLYTEPNILWANYSEILGVPLIATSRGTDILVTIKSAFESKSILNFFVSRLYKRAFGRCYALTSTSESQLTLLGKYGLRFNGHVIRTGIEVEKIDLAISEELDQIERPYVLFPRNMSPVYNHELAILAINQLPVEIQKRYAFVFVDSDSDNIGYVNIVRKMMDENSVAEFMFLERQNQRAFWQLLSKAELVVMTNQSDGSPVSAMETMYLETPILMSPLNYDDIFEDIPKFESFSPQSVATSILNALNTKNSDDLKSRKARVAVCSTSVEMKKVDSLYKDSIKA